MHNQRNPIKTVYKTHSKNLSLKKKWLTSKYDSILAAADLCLPHARLQEASAIYPTKLTPTLLIPHFNDLDRGGSFPIQKFILVLVTPSVPYQLN